MLGSPDLSAVLGAPTPTTNTDPDAVRSFIREACKLGLSLLLVFPDSKQPADMRTSRTRNADDRAAQDAAKAAGRADWAKVKSPSGLALASSDAAVVLKYYEEFLRRLGTWHDADGNVVQPKGPKEVKASTLVEVPRVNLAVEVGGSRLVVVDCDTAAQKARFLAWAQAPADLPPTVRSPGQLDAGGEMVHKDGGHYYFTVPDDVELPANLGAITMSGDDGFAVLWNRRYVLIPPSTRPEGPYTLVGDPYSIHDCPPLLAEIQAAGALRAQRAAEFEERQRQRQADGEAGGVSNLDAIIAAWAEGLSWATVLEPLGWTPASRNDTCGCPVWTAGAGHASPKSATAHDSGCSLGRYTPDGPLHIWTDFPGEPFESWIAAHGTKTMSKLQVVALTEYDGNVAKAMDALGLIPTPQALDAQGNPQDMGTVAREAGVDTSGLDRPIWGEDAPGTPPPWEPAAPVATSNHMSGTASDVDVPSPWAAASDTPATEPELDQFGTSPAVLTVKCAGCDEVHAKANILVSPVEFAQDADGDWWHAEFAEDGVPDGGHLLLADATTMTPELADALSMNDPHIDPAPEPDLFAGVGPGQTPPPPADDSPFAADADEPADPDVLDSPTFGVPLMAPFSHWRDMPPPEYIIDGLLEHGGLSCIIGPPGVGKSSVALDMACHIATGKRWQGRQTLKTKVLYMPGEGLSGAVQRIAAWEEAHGMEVGRGLILANSIVKLGASSEVWQEVGNFIIRAGIGFIIFDTFARMALAVEENSATEVGKAVERFDQIRRHTNAGVLIVHHTGKHSETARGSSALNGALDSELLVRNGQWDTSQIADANGRLPGKPIELDTTKQKNSEQLQEPLPLMMVNWEARQAPIITGPGGAVDPMQGEIVLARPTAEPVVETAIRMADLITARFPEQGLTRADIVQYLQMDPYTAGRADAPKAWRQKVGEAVDRGLRYDLIQTLTGTAAGGRYIGSAGTAETARQLFAAENINNNGQD